METRYHCKNCNAKLFNPSHLLGEDGSVLTFSKPVTPGCIHLALQEVNEENKKRAQTIVHCNECEQIVGRLVFDDGMKFFVQKEELVLV